MAALTAAGLDGCQALVLFALSEDLPVPMFQDSRGWSADEWEAARSRLEARGLVPGNRVMPSGFELRSVVERTADELAALPFAELDDGEGAEAFEQLSALSVAVAAGGDIPFPNPMGLPAPGPG